MIQRNQYKSILLRLEPQFHISYFPHIQVIKDLCWSVWCQSVIYLSLQGFKEGLLRKKKNYEKNCFSPAPVLRVHTTPLLRPFHFWEEMKFPLPFQMCGMCTLQSDSDLICRKVLGLDPEMQLFRNLHVGLVCIKYIPSQRHLTSHSHSSDHHACITSLKWLC